MPELPEVETFKQYLENTSLRKEISEAVLHREHVLLDTKKGALVKALEGNKLTGAIRHGKFLFIRLAKGGYLLIHFGLTGDFEFVEKEGQDPRFTLLLLKFRNGSKLAYTDPRQMGKIALVDDVNKFIRNRGYGPDALTISREDFIERLEGRRTNIKTALMNQKLLAGVGNEYSDEILFQVGLHPESRVDKLPRKLLENIWKEMRKILDKAVSVNADRDQLEEYFFLDNRKAGLECPNCKGKTESKTVGGRSAYFCPSCQELIA
jgi:formamidopyrimidine-DNA glycosylase